MENTDLEPGALETDRVEVRTLTPADLEWVAAIDARHVGRNRRDYLRVKLAEAERDTNMRVSLAAFIDGCPAGFLMGRVYYGEFGMPEPAAILDTIGVDPACQGKQAGKALMRQFVMNLKALHVERIQTLVEWEQPRLMGFFQHLGFRPAPRLCLELDTQAARIQ